MSATQSVAQRARSNPCPKYHNIGTIYRLLRGCGFQGPATSEQAIKNDIELAQLADLGRFSPCCTGSCPLLQPQGTA